MAEHYGFNQSTTTSADLKLLKKLFTQLHSDPSTASIWNSDPSTARRTPIQARREERQSKHGERNSDPSTTRRASIQAHRSVTSADPLLSVSVGESVCGCVWFCGVYGWFCGWFLIFVVDFWFCLWECVYERKGRWLCRWRRERTKGAKLKIIKIMYRRATIIVHICMVTVAHENF